MFRYLAFLPPIAIDDAPGSARFSGRISHALVSLTAAAAGLRLDVWAFVEGFWMKSRNRVPPTTRRGGAKMLSPIQDRLAEKWLAANQNELRVRMRQERLRVCPIIDSQAVRWVPRV